MITTKSNEDGLTFHHNGNPEDGELMIVVDPSKIKVEMDRFGGTQYVTVTLEYNTIRDFVLSKLRDHEIAKLEKLHGEQLAAYFTS